MLSATADLYRPGIHIEAFQQLPQHFALCHDEPLMKLPFHAFEVFPGKRAGPKSFDVFAQSFQRYCCTTVAGGGHRRDMKY